MSDGWLHMCVTRNAQVCDGESTGVRRGKHRCVMVWAFRVFLEGGWGVEAGLVAGCFPGLRFKRV